MMQGSEGPYIQYEQLVSRNPYHMHRWSHRDETGNELSSFDEELTVASRSGISLKSIFRVVGTMANITGQTTSKMLLQKKCELLLLSLILCRVLWAKYQDNETGSFVNNRESVGCLSMLLGRAGFLAADMGGRDRQVCCWHDG